MRWLAVLTILSALGCGKPAEDKPPPPGTAPRLISLTPSATEVVAALGATAMLVGVDEYSEWPPEVKQLPKVGSFMTPNLEVIIKLKPTLVIVDDIHANAAGALHDAGVTTVECKMHALADVKSALLTVGARIGRTTEAEAQVAHIDQTIADAIAKRPAKRPRVLVILDREAKGLANLVAAGTGSYADELLAIVGGENVLAAAGVRYPKISIEEVLRTAPELILDLSFAGRAGLDPWKAIELPEGKTFRVIGLPEPYLSAPSPRVPLALSAMANALR